jgi:hypothetical protein
LSSPHCEGQEQHQLKLNDYGLGVDCHSRFFQICLLVNTGKSLVTNEITVRAVWTPGRIETSRDDIEEDETLDQG